MKIRINLLLGIIVCFLVANKVCAQTIGLAGPTTAVTSGALATFTVTGETANKYMGTVPKYADAINNDLLVPGVTCQLWETDFYTDNRVGGKFKYKLINENTVAKTVELKFRTVIVTIAGNGSLTTTDQYFSCTVTINPAPPLPENIPDLVTFPSKTQNKIGVKLVEENLEFKWNASKLTSSTVDISLYYGSMLVMKKSAVPNNGVTIFDFSEATPIVSSNIYTKTFAFNTPDLNTAFDNFPFYNLDFFIQVKEVNGSKFGNSGNFCFVNDHPNLMVEEFPEVFIDLFPNSFWIFRTVTSSGNGEFMVDWLADRIDASNVTIDLYDNKRNFIKKLSTSTPNSGHFLRPPDASIPRGNQIYYQLKITSIENPSQFGYSDIIHHFVD